MKTATQILKENGIEYTNFISMADHNSVEEAMKQYAIEALREAAEKGVYETNTYFSENVEKAILKIIKDLK